MLNCLPVQDTRLRFYTQLSILPFAEFIGQFILSKAKVIPSGRIFKIAYEGRLLAGAVAKVLYSGATIYLDRKYALARQLCGDLLS
jgi:hypothetical protein